MRDDERNGNTASANCVVAKYTYDVWGKCTVEKYFSDDIGDVNPFRWKSHYYDADCGMYYVGGRFYDPETMQFVNAADMEIVAENALDANMLDRNGIMCDNAVEFYISPYAIFSGIRLFADTDIL